MKKNVFFPLLLLFVLLQESNAALNPVVDSIQMRDNKYLKADIYIPSGCSGCPAILIQTPYSRLPYRNWLPLGVGLNINSSNYVFVIVDRRGFWGSASALDPNADPGEDGYDVIEWISNQPWSDGKVGTWGPSALGIVQFQTAREQHPAHKCAVPQVASPVIQYQDYYQGGVYKTEYVEQLDALGFGVSTWVDMYPVNGPVWNLIYAGSYYPSSIQIPVLMEGGWYDHNSERMLEYFNALRSSSALAVRDQHRLVMGPWVHGGHGASYVGSATQGALSYPAGAGWSDSLAMAFFDYHLRGVSNAWNTTPYVQYFQMGEDYWTTSSVWPPTGVLLTKLYLQNDHSLALGIPANASGQSTFAHNPTDPSPSIGGPCMRMDLLQGPYDQYPLVENGRTDITIFESPALGANVVMKGNATVHLFVSSDQFDTDFAVRLTDVYPNGTSMILLDGIRRMRFRDGFLAADTSNIVPGQVYEVDIELPTSCITFLTGHKIRVDITSANYPRFDVNLNNGDAMYTAGDTVVANNTVYHNATQASYIELMLEDYLGSVVESAEMNFSLYPNPSDDFVTLSGYELNSIMEICDMNGKIIYSRKLAGASANIETTGMASGIYFVKITGEKTAGVKKLIIE